MIKYFCDDCGKQIKDVVYSKGNIYENVDVCKSCADKYTKVCKECGHSEQLVEISEKTQLKESVDECKYCKLDKAGYHEEGCTRINESEYLK
jgi:hypothetical protein